MTKAQAYNDLVNKANKNFNCALPAIAVGAIIGFFVFFVGWVIGWPDRCPIGYSNRGGGETIRAGQRWLRRHNSRFAMVKPRAGSFRTRPDTQNRDSCPVFA